VRVKPGSEKWGAGPTIVALQQKEEWTYGVLANHLSRCAGDDDRSDVNSTFAQPFLSCTTHTALTITLNSETPYDWEGEAWTVPINLQVSQILKLEGHPVSLGAGFRHCAESPVGGPEWGPRLILTFLFPT